MFNKITKIFIIIFVGIVLLNSCKENTTKPIANDPVIDKIDPINGIIGQVVRLYGKYFGAERGSSYVQFADAKATEYLDWNDSLIIVRVPEKALTGQVSVVVNNKEVIMLISQSVKMPDRHLSAELIPTKLFAEMKLLLTALIF